ncbi:MAG: hypothetical protein PHD43_11300 [Methylococcales bacterium]|nr:hypothetical protein [Methylococcales bacterium]
MSTTKPKSKKTATETHEIEPPIEKEVTRKISKKPSIAKSSETTEIKVAVETLEKEVKSSSKKNKIFKAKVIRDSFSFPEQDYLKISELKKTCLASGIHVKKGEILRAGLHLLSKLSLAELKQAVEQVEKVQTGRPSSSKN